MGVQLSLLNAFFVSVCFVKCVRCCPVSSFSVFVSVLKSVLIVFVVVPLFSFNVSWVSICLLSVFVDVLLPLLIWVSTIKRYYDTSN